MFFSLSTNFKDMFVPEKYWGKKTNTKKNDFFMFGCLMKKKNQI